MYCEKCGTPYTEGDTFCSNCGTSLKGNSLKGNSLLDALKHPLFLVLCILITGGCGLAIINKELSVISILLTIFFWLTYASAAKGMVSQKHLRCISGTIFASYVVNFVIFGAIAFVGIMMAIVLPLVGTGSWIASFVEIETELQELHEVFAGGIAGMTFLSITAIVLLIVCLIVAVVGIVLNILGFRKIHKFAQSVYLNAYSENPIFYKPSVVCGWLIVFSVFFGLSALSNLEESFLWFLEEGAYCAACIVGHIWIRKYFSAKQAAKE